METLEVFSKDLVEPFLTIF
jgi:hypothetical protein